MKTRDRQEVYDILVGVLHEKNGVHDCISKLRQQVSALSQVGEGTDAGRTPKHVCGDCWHHVACMENPANARRRKWNCFVRANGPLTPVLRVGQWVRWNRDDGYSLGIILRPASERKWYCVAVHGNEGYRGDFSLDQLEPAIAFDSNGIPLWPGDKALSSVTNEICTVRTDLPPSVYECCTLHKRAVKVEKRG